MKITLGKEKCSRNEFNAVITLVYLFQFSLLIPVSIFINLDIALAVSSITLAILLIVKNIKSMCFNMKTVLLFFVPLILILFKLLESDSSIMILAYYLSMGCSGIFIGSFRFDIDFFLKKGYALAVITFIVLCWVPFFLLDNVSYMRFGYGLLPSAIFLTVGVFYKSEEVKYKKIYLFIGIVASFEIVLYGARGAIFAYLLFLFFCFFFLVQKKYIWKCMIVGVCLIIWFSFFDILIWINKILLSWDISSRTINKLLLAYSDGIWDTTSGRDRIYTDAIEKIIEHPLTGNSLSNSTDISSIEYYHNIFLQLGVDFGLGMVFFFFIVLLVSLVKVLKRGEKNAIIIYFILFSISIGRLMFSSSYWLRPEFWLFLSIYFSGTLFENKRNSLNRRASISNKT